MQPDLILRGANLPDGRRGHDILIKDGLIQAVGPAIDVRGREELDVSGRLVTPPFVDCHFHMDATLSLGLPFMAAFLNPSAWGADFARKMETYPNMAGMWIVGEDMPRATNWVTLHGSEKDAFGLPIPNVHFDDHPNDIAMRSHAFKQGTAVYEAAGAREVFETPPYPSTHNLGTNRMSANARDGVVNEWGQTHDIKNLFVSDGSQFTTGAAENPTLTIVALAIRQAEYIADQMGKREI